MDYDYLIVGAGFAGTVLAERLATQKNKTVLLVEKRRHIGGNAYDEFDQNGILVHRYGPHIFHTNSREVFDYLSMFTEWIPYEHRVLASVNGVLYPIPVNRETLNKFYKLDLRSDEEVKYFYEKVSEKRHPILNSEDVIVNKLGRELFDTFFKHFTKKQWGLEPAELSPVVCGRIPVRTGNDCRYFGDKFQFMPKHGYFRMFEKMLSHRNIKIVLNTDYKSVLDKIKFNKMIYTGPIDYFFDYKFGRLSYRSVRFEFENHKVSEYQQAAQINYTGFEVPYTRVTEYKKITGQEARSTTISREFPETAGEPFYPVPSASTNRLYKRYDELAGSLKNVIFCGLLAEYRYFNMDQVVANTLNIFKGLAEDDG